MNRPLLRCLIAVAALTLGPVLGAAGVGAPEAAARQMATAPTVTGTIAPVSLPAVSGRVEDVTAAITTDQSIRWAAYASIRDDDVTTITALPVPPGQEVLSPGTHQIRLSDTTVFNRAGPARVHFEVRDVETSALLGVTEIDVAVFGRFRSPSIGDVGRSGRKVAAHGKVHQFVESMKVELQAKRRGANGYRTVATLPVSRTWKWSTRFAAKLPTVVRARVISNYGSSPFSKSVRLSKR